MTSKITINPEKLNAMIKKRGVNKKALSDNPRTVSRWCSGEVTRLQARTFAKLCQALNATEADLCGEGPLPKDPPTEPPPRKDQMNMMVDGACRNALAFVAKRYGVTRQQIVEIAPLLFFVAAERSLQERKERLSDSTNALDDAEKALPSHLFSNGFSLAWEEDEAFSAEKRSIEMRDLFGETISLNVKNEASKNPFEHFLTNQLASLQPESKLVQWDIGESPYYFICVGDILDYVGADKDAAILVLKGSVTLHDMPAEVRNSSAQKRAEWIRKRWEEINETEQNFAIDTEDLIAWMETLQSTPPAAEDDL